MQIAALMGVGLLYLGSAHRHMVEVALKQIGHTPGPELEFAENRESYSLAAGFTLGMVTLGVSWLCSEFITKNILIGKKFFLPISTERR